MSLYALTSLVASVSCLALAVLVQLKDNRNPLYQAFTKIVLLAGVWTTFPLLISLPADPDTALSIGRIVYAFAAFVPTAFLHFTFVFLRCDAEPRARLVLRASLACSILFVAISITPYLIQGL